MLTLAKLHLNVLPAPPATENEDSIQKIKHLLTKAIGDLRHLSKSLHPDRVSELSLEENIKQELDLLEKSGLYKTRLHMTGAVYKLEASKQIIVFRIVQEGISNIIKHAGANLVEIKLVYEPEVFSLEINDNGTGFDKATLNEHSTGIGLRNMQNRCALIHATLNIEPAVPSGTFLKVTLPVKSSEK